MEDIKDFSKAKVEDIHFKEQAMVSIIWYFSVPEQEHQFSLSQQEAGKSSGEMNL